MMNTITDAEEARIDVIAKKYIRGLGEGIPEYYAIDFAKEVLRMEWRDEVPSITLKWNDSEGRFQPLLADPVVSFTEDTNTCIWPTGKM